MGAWALLSSQAGAQAPLFLLVAGAQAQFLHGNTFHNREVSSHPLILPVKLLAHETTSTIEASTKFCVQDSGTELQWKDRWYIKKNLWTAHCMRAGPHLYCPLT